MTAALTETFIVIAALPPPMSTDDGPRRLCNLQEAISFQVLVDQVSVESLSSFAYGDEF